MALQLSQLLAISNLMAGSGQVETVNGTGSLSKAVLTTTAQYRLCIIYNTPPPSQDPQDLQYTTMLPKRERKRWVTIR